MRLPMIIAATLLLVTSVLTAAAPQTRYAVGQIWEYKTRAGDEGSLVKIQQIETDPALVKLGPIFHISIIGMHLSNPRVQPVLPHLPVSQATLDASVTRLHTEAASFPDATSGIAEWRAAKGGVFTISLAEIVAIMDAQTAHVGE